MKGREDSTTVYAVGIDVTDEDEILRRLLRSERLAAVGTLAAGLAHEVRNPLNSASLQLTVLERRLDRSEDPTERAADRAHHQERDRSPRSPGARLPGVRAPAPLDPRPVDVGAAARRRRRAHRAGSGGRQVAIAVDADRRLPARPGDAERLRQVLLNLTRNAVEAMDEHGGRLRLAARAAGAEVEIDVEDDGPGFAEELPVFDAFFTTKSQGTGLGLAIVHRIVADHGGTIRVESRPGRTCFTLALPAAT